MIQQYPFRRRPYHRFQFCCILLHDMFGTSGGLFGSPSSGGLFGQQRQQQNTGLFGQTAPAASGGLFGSSTGTGLKD